MTTKFHPDPPPITFMGQITREEHTLSAENAAAINAELDESAHLAAGAVVMAEKHEAGMYYRLNGTLVPLV